MKIFISYSSKQTQIIWQIYDLLKKNHYDVFLDKEKLELGQKFPDQLEEAIKHSDGLIILITPDSVSENSWVHKEIEFAIKHWKNLDNRIIPVIDKNNDVQEILIPESIRFIQRLECDKDLPAAILDAVKQKWPILKIINYENPTPELKSNKARKVVNPYLNLSHYGPENKKLFFGREDFIDKIIKRIVDHKKTLTVITGPSGSGKSSVVLAGIVPSLSDKQKDKWQFTYFRPRIHPFKEIAYALSPLIEKYSNSPIDLADELQRDPKSIEENLKSIRTAISKDQNLMIIIDQFDEIFYSNIEDETCSSFVNCLLLAINSSKKFGKIFFVITLKKSSLDDSIFLKYPEIYKNFSDNESLLPQIKDPELKDIIVKPAVACSFRVSDRLVKKLITEVKEKSTPQSIALLELSLWMIFENWSKKRAEDDYEITIKDYDSMNIKTVITLHASNVLGKLENKEQVIAEKIFSSLLFKNEHTAIMPRIASGSSLRKFWPIVEKLASADFRLIVINSPKQANNKSAPANNESKSANHINDDTTIEVIHEALIRHWEWVPTVVLKNHKSFIEDQDRFEKDARSWAEKGYRSKSLPNGDHYKKIKDFEKENYPLSQLVINFANAKKRRDNKITYVYPLIGFVFLSFGAACLYQDHLKDEAKEMISEGERSFIKTHYLKRSGVQYVNKENFEQASDAFEKSYKLLDDPEALIYWHNSNIKLRGHDTKYFEIIVSAPMEKNPIIAQEILRGVAQAQHEFNPNWEKCEKEPALEACSNPALFISLANDDNESEKAKKIINYVIKDKPEILAVIGHNASNVSNDLIEIYQKNKMLMISPTSFALDFDKIEKNKNGGKNFVYSLAFDVSHLITKLFEKIPIVGDKKILLCYDSNAHDQVRFKNLSHTSQYKNAFSDIDCDFHKPDPIPGILTDQNIRTNGISSLILAPHVNTIHDAINMAMENKNIKPKLKLYASPTLYNQNTLLLGGEAVEDMILPVYWHASSHNNDVNKNFINKANELWRSMNGVTWRTALAYDATQLVINGIKQLGKLGNSVDRDNLQHIISNPNNKMLGITGEIEFDKKNGERLNSSAYLVEVKKEDNTYKFVPLN